MEENKTKTETSPEKTDNVLTSNEETNAMRELQKGYEKQIATLKTHYEDEIKKLKSEHTTQIRNILLGKNIINNEDDEDNEDERIKELIKEINDRR